MLERPRAFGKRTMGMQETSSRGASAVRLWAFAVAALIFAMVLIGGATRLTEFGPLHHAVEAAFGRHPAAYAGGLERRVRGLQAHPAICRAQRRHDARGFQEHLLVGMGTPAARPHHRRGLHPSRALRSSSGLAVRRARPARRAGDRAAGAGADRRLVDGVLGPRRSHRGRAGPPRAPPADRRGDLRRADPRRRWARAGRARR